MQHRYNVNESFFIKKFVTKVAKRSEEFFFLDLYEQVSVSSAICLFK